VTARRLAALAAASLACTPVGACELVLSEHRSGLELLVLPLPAADPQAQLAFEHSVLGTTVVDRYRFTPAARLVEERFDGQGYGLPHTAGPGETLQRDGSGWRLRTDRSVSPLVVRPLPQQQMRLLLGGREWRLASLSTQAIELTARGCPASPSP
jgi:hypothetical protein